MGLMITHLWRFYCGTHKNPRAALGAVDLRTVGARRLRNYRLIFSFWVSHCKTQEKGTLLDFKQI